MSARTLGRALPLATRANARTRASTLSISSCQSRAAEQSRNAFRPAYAPIAWQRWLTTAAPAEIKQHQFEDIKKLSQSPSEDRFIIDVREPDEYSAGFIPNAINIPVKSRSDAIFMSPEEFEERLGFSKPPEDKEVIFYCKSGVRSNIAAQLARQQGYKNIAEYKGSWLDWEKNGGTIAKP